MTLNLAESNEAIDAFWRAFEERRSLLAAAQSAEDRSYDECLAVLQRVEPGLYFEFSFGQPPHELIISADGNRALFPIARRVVERAPSVDGWIVRALKPRLGFPVKTTWEHLEVRIADVVFEPVESGDGIGLLLYVAHLRRADEERAHNAILRAIDHGLGEQRFAETVQFTEIAALPEGRALSEFLALTELEGYIERRARDGTAR